LAEKLVDTEALMFQSMLPLTARACGQFVSRGRGRHMRRVAHDYELIFVTKGVLEMQVGEKSFAVAAGETLLLTPHVEHWGTADYEMELSYFWLHFQLNITHIAGTSEGFRTSSEAFTTSIPEYCAVERPDYLAELFRRYLDDQTGRYFDPLSRNLLLWLILSETHPLSASRHDPGPLVLASLADNYIQKNFHHHLTTAVVAEHLGCNPQYLSRIYHQAFGQTLTETIHRKRTTHACHLLLNTEMRVNEIARSCGMEDVSYFLQLFKRHKGMTALAFRRLHARNSVSTE
jgi:AraC-like DNA-binding protein